MAVSWQSNSSCYSRPDFKGKMPEVGRLVSSSNSPGLTWGGDRRKEKAWGQCKKLVNWLCKIGKWDQLWISWMFQTSGKLRSSINKIEKSAERANLGDTVVALFLEFLEAYWIWDDISHGNVKQAVRDICWSPGQGMKLWNRWVVICTEVLGEDVGMSEN